MLGTDEFINSSSYVGKSLTRHFERLAALSPASSHYFMAMYFGKSVLLHLLDGIHHWKAQLSVSGYGGEYHVRSFSCWG